jgi:hypothetical protein
MASAPIRIVSLKNLKLSSAKPFSKSSCAGRSVRAFASGDFARRDVRPLNSTATMVAAERYRELRLGSTPRKISGRDRRLLGISAERQPPHSSVSCQTTETAMAGAGPANHQI